MVSQSKQLFIKLFKWFPPIAVLIIFLHVTGLLFGYEAPITEFLIDSSLIGGVMYIVSSFMFDMCRLHKSCIWYVITAALCNDIKRVIGFGVLAPYVRWVLFTIGLVLLILLLRKYVRDNPCSTSR